MPTAHGRDLLLAEPGRRALKTPVPILSGCADPEVSYDAWIDDTPQGAASWAYLKTLNEGNPATYAAWIKLVRGTKTQPGLLPSIQYPQHPDLVGAGHRPTGHR